MTHVVYQVVNTPFDTNEPLPGAATDFVVACRNWFETSLCICTFEIAVRKLIVLYYINAFLFSNRRWF